MHTHIQAYMYICIHAYINRHAPKGTNTHTRRGTIPCASRRGIIRAGSADMHSRIDAFRHHAPMCNACAPVLAGAYANIGIGEHCGFITRAQNELDSRDLW